MHNIAASMLNKYARKTEIPAKPSMKTSSE